MSEQQPVKYRLMAHKDGMSWKTNYDEQTTIAGVHFGIEKLLTKGFTYITIEVKKQA